MSINVNYGQDLVSTHSHPKVAAYYSVERGQSLHCFNTQPPEGGCAVQAMWILVICLFQHTATRRWLHIRAAASQYNVSVSTHSHPKVAARGIPFDVTDDVVSTHSHPKVAAEHINDLVGFWCVSTHSHPKVAAVSI